MHDDQKNIENIKITIVMPCLNADKYIKRCLDSVINQSLKELEIICVDGGSTDDTLNIISYFMSFDKRIKLINSNQKSYGYQMNIGFEHAKGEYLAIVEPDDYIELDMYEKLYEIANRSNVDFVKSNFYKFSTDENKNEKTSLIKLSNNKKLYNKIICPSKKMVIFDFEIPNWTGIFKRSFIIKNGILHNETPGASFQDTGFWFSTFSCAKKCIFLDKAFYHYRIDNPSSSINSNKIYCVFDEYKFIKKFLEDKKLFKKFSSVYFYYMFIHYRGTSYRLNNKEWNIFINKFRNDFISAYRERKLNVSRFNISEINELYYLLELKQLSKIKKIIRILKYLSWVAKHDSIKQSVKTFVFYLKKYICHSK